MAAPLVAAAGSPLAAAGITAGASLVGGLISAKQRRKQRKQDAEMKAAEIEQETGKQKQKALSDIVGNFRSALIR